MLVDTGASFSFLTEDFLRGVEADRRRIKAGYGVRYTDAAGADLRDYVTIRGLEIGAWHTKPETKVDFLVMTDAMARNGVDGIVGLNILKVFFDLEINFAAGKITFYRPNQCAKSEPVYWAKEWAEIPLLKRHEHTIVKVELDGSEFAAAVDTGASVSLLDDEAGSDAFDLTTKQAGDSGDLTAISGQVVNAQLRVFDSMKISKLTVAKPNIYVAKIGSKTFNMILGLDQLRQFRLYFAFKRNLLYATPAVAPPAPAN